MQLIKIQSTDKLPFDLLLLADETITAIEKYIYESEVYILSKGEQAIGVVALYRLSANELEIKNMAIAPLHQSQGIGSWLIRQVVDIAREQHYKILIVGTADAGQRQISFYEHNGFRKFALRKNFFTEHYPQPIFENGIRLKDMLLLRREL